MLLTLMDMFAEMGDKIALQYGGSEAHNKVCCMYDSRILLAINV
jgi:hypothetical protein